MTIRGMTNANNMNHYISLSLSALLLLAVAGAWGGCQSESQGATTPPETVAPSSPEPASAPPAASAHPGLPELPAEEGPAPRARAVTDQELSGWTRLSWETLEDVTFKDQYFEKTDGYFMVPEYGASVKELSDREVFISGYLIPVDVNWYILSAFPYSACFFCGNAGPESVVELSFEETPRRFKTDEWLTFKGTFTLNPEDIDHLPYMLTKAELIELEEE